MVAKERDERARQNELDLARGELVGAAITVPFRTIVDGDLRRVQLIGDVGHREVITPVDEVVVGNVGERDWENAEVHEVLGVNACEALSNHDA